MSPGQALDMLDRIVSQVRMTREETMTTCRAVEVLRQALGQPVEQPTDDE